MANEHAYVISLTRRPGECAECGKPREAHAQNSAYLDPDAIRGRYLKEAAHILEAAVAAEREAIAKELEALANDPALNCYGALVIAGLALDLRSRK